jgi:hypothetical protein
MKLALLIFLFPVFLFAEDFSKLNLPDAFGVRHSLNFGKQAKAIVLIAHGVACPVVRQTYPRIESLVKTYKKKDIQFFYVNGNLQDDNDTLKEEIKEYKISIPILIDREQKLLLASKLKVTSEAVIIGKSGEIIYKGAITDQINYEISKEKASKEFLKDALDDLLAHRPVKVRETSPAGCYITFKKTSI